MNEIRALLKEIPESPPAPSAVGRHRGKTAIDDPGSGISPDAESADALILGLQNREKVHSCAWKPLGP